MHVRIILTWRPTAPGNASGTTSDGLAGDQGYDGMSEDATTNDELAEDAYGATRLTPQRRRIAEAAASMGAFTIEDLSVRLESQTPRTPLATVYRAIRALEGTGSVQRVGAREGSDLYVWCVAEDHHHHLVCTGCGAVEHTPCPYGEDGPRPADVAGYTSIRHEMTLYGLCASCTQNPAGD